MPAKTPMYLKTPTDRRGRKLRLRDFLSGDMISRPLGDVRHSAHVGLQGLGDMFGDVTFLQGNMDMLPSQPDWPSYITSEDAPPKPPRLHLDLTPCSHLDPAPCSHLNPALCSHLDTAPFSHLDPAPCSHLDPAPCSHLDSAPFSHLDPAPCSHLNPAPCSHLDPTPHHGPTHCSHSIQRLVPWSTSSSEDSLNTCGPLGTPRGLCLDSDAGLSNEDLHTDHSPLPHSLSKTLSRSDTDDSPLFLSKSLPRSDSVMTALDLDLGPSIMDDILSVMERYKGPSLSLQLDDHLCK